MDDGALAELAHRLTEVEGVVAVTLGGSRASGTHSPDSDVDLGLYYRPPLDVEALTLLAREVADEPVEATQPGQWGPWVDGGAWLRIGGVAVDWLYRDLERVHRAWDDAQAGRYAFHTQAGHPLGVPDFAYAGEVALGVLLADPSGELGSLQRQVRQYPAALGQALVHGLWEASFAVEGAAKAVSRDDTAYVAGCLFRAVGLCAHALHGSAGRWLVNEKGAVSSAGALPCAPLGFAERAHGLLAALGTGHAELAVAVASAQALVADTVAACAAGRAGAEGPGRAR